MIRRANETLAELDIEPISEAVTPHSLRRTYASLRFGLGHDPVYVARQLGHTEAAFSMSVYADAIKRRERLFGSYLAEFDTALDWAAMGSQSDSEGVASAPRQSGRMRETASQSRKLALGPDSSVG